MPKPSQPEKLPFCLARTIERVLRRIERDLAYNTEWLIECEWNVRAAVNEEIFLAKLARANDRYARALRSWSRLKPIVYRVDLFA
jgi:hypothetical protein